ncbi:MAG: hypothetical protein JXM70_27065 [Pirellulales bacterium]|nr:hypothetical protein [Pirellulales bacterium]
MSSTKKKITKRLIEDTSQQAPCEDDKCSPAPTKANKITLAISLAMLMGWIGFLAVLAIGK